MVIWVAIMPTRQRLLGGWNDLCDLAGDDQGGVGKTTTIQCISSELRARGMRILGLDADPESRLKAWADQRNDPEFVVIDGINEQNLRETVRTHAADYDVVFIDL